MDVYPATADVSIPNGVVARSFRGWYTAPEMPPTVVSLDSLKAIRGAAGLLNPPPDAAPLLLGEPTPDMKDTEIWRSILRASLNGAG